MKSGYLVRGECYSTAEAAREALSEGPETSETFSEKGNQMNFKFPAADTLHLSLTRAMAIQAFADIAGCPYSEAIASHDASGLAETITLSILFEWVKAYKEQRINKLGPGFQLTCSRCGDLFGYMRVTRSEKLSEAHTSERFTEYAKAVLNNNLCPDCAVD